MNEAPAQPDAPPSKDASLPTAVVVARRGWFSWAWLAPLLALACVGFLAWQAMATRGPVITIEFHAGEGLAPGDPVTFRGVRIGAVRSVTLSPSLNSVLVRAELNADAAAIAAEGSRFWIVRPEVSLRKVSGLETLLGPRYIVAEPAPAGSARADRFVGLDWPQSPTSGTSADGGLSIVVMARRATSLAVGSPVSFREVRVGSVTDVRLSDDARSVDIGVVIDPAYAHLVRTNSRFWNVSGIGLDLGLMGGLKFKAESLESVLVGGVGFATPDHPGEIVSAGHRFVMEDAPNEDWLEWSPALTPAAPKSPAALAP